MKRSRTRSLLISISCFTLVLSISLLAPSAFAQGLYLAGPSTSPNPTPPPGSGTVGGEPIPGGGVNPLIKTAPLQAGQAVSIPIDVHNATAATLPNWAGVLVQVHRVDPSEVDIAAVKVGGVPILPNPFPTSGGPGGTVATYTVFHPAAFLSGTSLPNSGNMRAITLDLIAKNTDPMNNSDVDILLAFADIYHQPDVRYTTRIVTTLPSSFHFAGGGSTVRRIPTPGSTMWHWESSHRVFVNSETNSMTDLHLTAGGHQANSQVPFPNADPALNEFESNFAVPPGGADPQTGKFHHFPAGNVHRVASTVSFHVVGGPTSTTIPAGVPFTLTFTAFFPGSQIYAFPFLTTASIGIEHVPEPAAPLLLLGGIVSLAFGCRARRRRKQA